MQIRKRVIGLSLCMVLAMVIAHIAFVGPRVFESYWASGEAAGRGLDPYLAYPQTWIVELGDRRIADVNLNPPILLPLFTAMSKLPLLPAAVIWALGSTLIYVVAAWRLAMRYGLQGWSLIWLFASPLLFDTLVLGQIYSLLFALAVAAWLHLDRRSEIVAGLVVGVLVAIKPTFVVWPALLLLGGHWRVTAGAAASSVCLTAIGLLVYGPETYSQWLAALAADNHIQVPTEASLFGYFTRLGQPMIGAALAGVVLLATAGWITMRRPGVLTGSRVALPAMLLASPLAWPHYAMLLSPGVASEAWNRRRIAGALLLCFPTYIPMIVADAHPIAGALAGTPYMAGLAMILFSYFPLSKAAAVHPRDERQDRDAPGEAADPVEGQLGGPMVGQMSADRRQRPGVEAQEDEDADTADELPDARAHGASV